MATRICPMCNGTKFYPIGSDTPCYVCGAMGTKQTSLTRMGVDHYYSHEILGCIDDSEYTELSTAQRDIVKIILSMGIVDMAENSVGKTRLYDLFPEGTATRASLAALLGG